MRDDSILVEEPIAADLILHEDGFDAFIVMLHDQGHIPTKLLAKHRTAGPVDRQSHPVFICCPWQCSCCWARHRRAHRGREAVRRLVGPVPSAMLCPSPTADLYQFYGHFHLSTFWVAAFLDIKKIRLSYPTMPYDRRRKVWKVILIRTSHHHEAFRNF